MHRPGQKDLEIKWIHWSLKSLGFDIDNEDTNTRGYYCYDALAVEDARYQAMKSKYGGKTPSREPEYYYDVHHRNSPSDRYQTTMNNICMERRRMRKVPDNQSSCNVTAKIASETAAAAASTTGRGNEDPYDSDSEPAYQFPYFVQDRLEARLADVRAASAVEYPMRSPCMMPLCCRHSRLLQINCSS